MNVHICFPGNTLALSTDQSTNVTDTSPARARDYVVRTNRLTYLAYKNKSNI